MTAFHIGSTPMKQAPSTFDSVGPRADTTARPGGQSHDGAAPIFKNDALLAIEHGERLAEQADALAEYIAAEMDSEDEADRALREEETHEWIDPEALAEFLAETLQQDEDAQRTREALVADLQQGAPHTMLQLLRERCDNNPTKLFVSLQQAAGALRRGAVGSDQDQDSDAGQRAGRRGGGRREDTEAILERLADMTQELEFSHGTRIRADLNTGGVWQTPGDGRRLDAAEIVSLQASYATLVEGDTRIASVLHRVLDGVTALLDSPARAGTAAGENGTSPQAAGSVVQAVLERFILAVGRDIDSLRPSVDRAHLHALLTEKSHVTTAVTVLQQCDSLAEVLHPGSPADAGAAALQTMRKAVDLTDQSYFTPEAFVAFARTMAGQEQDPSAPDATPGTEGVPVVLARAIPFLHGFSAVLRDMPERVFVDDQQRMRAREAVQHALDDLIDEENAHV